MSELLNKQFAFTRLLPRLLDKAHELGYEVSLGEAYRTQEQAAIYAKQGKGIRNSLHTQRLAIDLNVFKDGMLLSTTEDYRPLGVYWESLSANGITCCWGGRFTPASKADGNHFSIEFNGIK